VEKLRTFQKYNVSLEEIEHRANSFSRCGCVRRGAATDANARRTASRQIALASFVDNTLQTIQWFSHGIFVLRPHFLRHRAVWLLHVPRMGSQLGETRPRHTLSSGPLLFSDGQKKSPGSFLSRPAIPPVPKGLLRLDEYIRRLRLSLSIVRPRGQWGQSISRAKYPTSSSALPKKHIVVARLIIERGTGGIRRKKTFSRALFLLGRTGRPLRVTGRVGATREDLSPSLSVRPTRRLLSKKTARMGDKAKPLVSWAGGFAV
jgi:hypothetical protein